MKTGPIQERHSPFRHRGLSGTKGRHVLFSAGLLALRDDDLERPWPVAHRIIAYAVKLVVGWPIHEKMMVWEGKLSISKCSGVPQSSAGSSTISSAPRGPHG